MPPKVVRFLGSIRLAVPLLIAIAVVLIGATFYESEVGSLTVQTQIYKSPWFGAMMYMLAVSLGISTLSRWTWKGPRKVGFASPLCSGDSPEHRGDAAGAHGCWAGAADSCAG